MPSEESEERKLPATEKKLREGRRKGQVPHGRDLVAGFTIFAALLYLFLAWPTVSARIIELAQTTSADSVNRLAGTAGRSVREALAAVLLIVGPLFAIVLATGIVFGIVATRGPVFSFEPVKPKFDNINPAKGLQRIASLRNLVEFGKSLAKAVILAALFSAVMMAWLQPMFEAPACGFSCIGPMIRAVLVPMGGAAALAFIAIGILDLPVQRWLFQRDMRMTRTEYRREHKDIEGDPLIRREQQRQRREAISRPTRLGIQQAVLAFTGGGRLVALRYVKDETPIPVVVARAEGEAARLLAADARRLPCVIVEDPALAEALFRQCRLGAFIEPQLFAPVVRHLVRNRLV